MDPQATINLINDYLATEDYEMCANSCTHLINWIATGGACLINNKNSLYWKQWAINIRTLCWTYEE